MEPRKLTIAEKVAGTAKFVASEIKEQVRKRVPGFMDLWRATEMSDEEIEADLQRLRTERFYNDLREAGFSQEVRICEPEEPEPRTAGPNSLSDLIRAAARRR